MVKKSTLLHNLWPIFTLILIECAVFYLSYIPGTYLIGWDNLHPEFNPLENVRRSLFGVWVEYRGLGLFDGMSHNANLIHSLFVYVLTFILPENIIRYVVISLLHVIGAIGLYILCHHLVKDKIAAFFAAVFYMFNIGTIQQFFAPFELFIFHYAFLPWIFYTGMLVIERYNPKRLLLFALINLLATPQAHVPTIFVAFGLALSGLIVYDIVVNKSIKKFIILGIITFCVNAFWLLPYAAGIPENAPIIQKSRINQYSFENVFQSNIVRGNIENVLQMKGFMLDFVQYDGLQKKDTNFMQVWKDHTDSTAYLLFYGLFLVITFIGIYVSFKKNHRKLLFLAVPLLVSIIFVANNTPLITQINQLIRIVPAINEAFRIPFTKFILILSFAFSVYLGIGIHYLRQKAYFRQLLPIILSLGICILCLPIFAGNFYSPLLRRELPAEYKEIFRFFQQQDKSKRIALLPTHLFWSWQHQDWGYGGSGFVWFGIPQPILLRAFDPWSAINEQFYNEMSTAMRSDDSHSIKNVLAKYSVDYLLLDEHALNNLAMPPEIDFQSIEETLANVDGLKVVATAGKLKVYVVEPRVHRAFISVLNNPPSVHTNGMFTYEDTAFSDYGNYITEQDAQIFSPFHSLFTEKLQSDRAFESELTDTMVTLSTQPGFFSSLRAAKEMTLSVPATQDTQYVVAYVTIDDKGVNLTPVIPQITLDNTTLAIKSNMLPLNFSAQKISSIRLNGESIDIKDGDFIRLNRFEKNTIDFYSDSKATNSSTFVIGFTPKTVTQPQTIKVVVKPDSILHVSYPLTKQDKQLTTLLNELSYESKPLTEDADLLSHASAYLTFVEGKRISGVPPVFYVDDPMQERLITESRIKEPGEVIFVIPRQSDLGKGYKFHIVNNATSQYQLEHITTVQLPYDYLKEILLYQDEPRPSSSTPVSDVTHTVPYEYVVKTSNEDGNYLYLAQGYNNKWQAYVVANDTFMTRLFPFLTGEKIDNHVKVNNWANGWKLPQNSAQNTIVILFWPQYLQYAGFGILGLILSVLCVVYFSTRKKNFTPLSTHAQAPPSST